MVDIGEKGVKIQAKIFLLQKVIKGNIFASGYSNSPLQAWCDCILSSQFFSLYLEEEI